MGKTSYKNTEELIKEISNKLSQLNNGNLDLEELNTLVEAGNDLYQQLIVLRYKAFDKYGEPETISKVKSKDLIAEKEIESQSTEKNVETEETPFDFTGISSNHEEETQPSFDFTLESEETQDTQEVTKVDEAVEEVKLTSKADDLDEIDSNSLNSYLKKEDEDLSLRKKLQNAAISDIKAHISIAKKFEYISNMFNGNNAAYDEAIDFLNTCATGKDAQLKLNELTTINSWNLEDKSIINFIELVERRYL